MLQRKTVADPPVKITPELSKQIADALRAAGVRNVYVAYWAVTCAPSDFTKAAEVLKGLPIDWKAIYNIRGRNILKSA